MNIEIISGSPRSNSLTHRVALFLKNYLSEKSEHSVDIIDVREWNIPQLEGAWMSAEKAPEELRPLAQRMFSADGFILVSPEYNGSYSGALKNLLDHFPKQVRKPFGVVTASPGALGGIRAAQQMQLLISALFGIGSPYMLVVPSITDRFDEKGTLTDAGFQKAVDLFAVEYLWLAESLNPVVEPAELI